MRIKFYIIPLLLIILTSCSQNYKKYSDSINVDLDYNHMIDSSLLSFTTDISKASNIGVLYKTNIPKLEKRIRIWEGFGVIRPDFMLEMRVKPNSEITGKLYVYYDEDLSYMEEDEKEFKEWVSSMCKEVLIEEDDRFLCEAKFKYEPKWSYYYKKLLRNNIFNLVDQSKLPKRDFIMLDGTGLVVEVKEGSDYRTYEYSNPGFAKHKEEHQASSILGIIGHLISKLYRTH